jgi:hypothetical protein
MRLLLVLFVAVTTAVVTVHATLPEQGVFFLKFFKVGGTTVAEVLGRLAQRDERAICCSTSACSMCYSHMSLDRYASTGHVTPHTAVGLVILRHPVEREISRYYFARATGDRVALRYSLEEWVGRVPRNEYLSVLGHGGGVEGAVAALDRDFALIGLTERTTDFLTAVGLTFNETPDAMAQRPLKRMVDRPRAQDLPASVISVLTTRLSGDIALYTRAAELVGRRMSALIAHHGTAVVEEYARAVDRLIAAQPACTGEHHSSPGLIGVDCMRIHE